MQGQHRLEAVAAVGRVLQRQRPDARHDRLGHRLRVSFSDRQQVLDALEVLRLELPLPLIEAGAVEEALAAGLGHVPQLLGEFEHGQTLLASFVHAPRFADAALVDPLATALSFLPKIAREEALEDS